MSEPQEWKLWKATADEPGVPATFRADRAVSHAFDGSMISDAERRRYVRLVVTQVLAEETTTSTAIARILAAVCSTLDWDVGCFWRYHGETRTLCCEEFWQQPTRDVISFRERTCGTVVPMEFSLPGRVWRGRQPVWIPEVCSDPQFLRAQEAREAGLLSAFACPVAVGQSCLGVLEWFGERMSQPDADLLEMMATLGGQIGQFIERREAEEALRESEQRYRAIVEGQAEMVCRFRPDGTILFVNGAYARARGTTAEELLGHSFWYFIEPADRPAVRELLERLSPEEPEVRIENRFETSSGTRWMLWTNRGLAFDADGRATEVQSSGIDITDRKRAEETIRSLLRISKRLNSTLDLDELLDILACEAIVLVGAESGLSGLRTPEGMVSKKYFRNGRPVPLEYCWPSMHGLPGWLLAHKKPYMTNDATADGQIVRDLCSRFGIRSAISTPIVTARGDVIGFFEVHNKPDGTAFSDSDMEILVAVSQVAAVAVQNGLAYRAMQRAEKSLKDADRRKDEFLAMLAHELRNPLAPIRSGLDVLAIEAAGNNPTIKLMQQQVDHLVRLVDDLLDVSRIVRGKVELRKEPALLAEIIDSSVEAIRPSTQERRQVLSVTRPDDPICVYADRVRLTQIFGNLLSNASKYSGTGGHIELVVERHGTDVAIRVRDDGMGIEPDLLPKVFDLFAQASGSLDRSQGGLGIGLTLVKSLVEMHGGSVTAHSDGRHKGSEFIVRLPIELSPPRKAEPPPAPLPSVARRVLIVEDNLAAATMLAMLLSKIGDHRVELAHDGPAALEKVEAFSPEIILLDIGLPGMDGYQVAEAIRRDAAQDAVLLVALSGYGQLADRRRSKQAGFDEHLVKPAERSVIERILAHPKLAR